MSASYHYVGRIVRMDQVQTFKSGYQSRTIRCTDEDGRYPQITEFTFGKNSMHLLDNVRIGDRVDIVFSLRGSEWKDRCFNKLDCTNIQVLGSYAPAPYSPASTASDTNAAADIPF